MIKKILTVLILSSLFIIFLNFNAIKTYLKMTQVNLPNDILSISDQLVTIDSQSSPKIILSVPVQNLEESIPFAEIIQTAISKNEIQIQNVYLIVFNASEKEKSKVISFLEKNNIYLQTIVDPNNQIKNQFKTETSVSVLSKNYLIWETTDTTELKNKNLTSLLRF